MSAGSMQSLYKIVFLMCLASSYGDGQSMERDLAQLSNHAAGNACNLDYDQIWIGFIPYAEAKERKNVFLETKWRDDMWTLEASHNFRTCPRAKEGAAKCDAENMCQCPPGYMCTSTPKSVPQNEVVDCEFNSKCVVGWGIEQVQRKTILGFLSLEDSDPDAWESLRPALEKLGVYKHRFNRTGVCHMVLYGLDTTKHPNYIPANVTNLMTQCDCNMMSTAKRIDDLTAHDSFWTLWFRYLNFADLFNNLRSEQSVRDFYGSNFGPVQTDLHRMFKCHDDTERHSPVLLIVLIIILLLIVVGLSVYVYWKRTRPLMPPTRITEVGEKSIELVEK